MKKFFIFLLFSCFAIGNVFAQNTKDKMLYKSLSSYGKDTLAYYLYNFVEQKDSLKGKKMSEVLSKLEVPVKYYFAGAETDPKNVDYARTLIFSNKNRRDTRFVIDNNEGSLYLLVLEFAPTVPFTTLNDYIKDHGDALASTQYEYFSQYTVRSVRFIAYPLKVSTAPVKGKK